MTDEERAYSRGQCHAYSSVFKAFSKAFDAGEDIHDLRARISAQWDGVEAAQTARAAL